MPKMMAWHKDEFSGDIWDFNQSSGNTIETVVRTYFYSKSVKFTAMSDGFGRLMIIFPMSVDDLRPVMQIRNLRDAGGREIIPDGRWLMTEFEPMLDIFGMVSGYRSRVSLNVTPEDEA